jgi:hypothetical protein
MPTIMTMEFPTPEFKDGDRVVSKDSLDWGDPWIYGTAKGQSPVTGAVGVVWDDGIVSLESSYDVAHAFTIRS